MRTGHGQPGHRHAGKASPGPTGRTESVGTVAIGVAAILWRVGHGGYAEWTEFAVARGMGGPTDMLRVSLKREGPARGRDSPAVLVYSSVSFFTPPPVDADAIQRCPQKCAKTAQRLLGAPWSVSITRHLMGRLFGAIGDFIGDCTE